MRLKLDAMPPAQKDAATRLLAPIHAAQAAARAAERRNRALRADLTAARAAAKDAGRLHTTAAAETQAARLEVVAATAKAQARGHT